MIKLWVAKFSSFLKGMRWSTVPNSLTKSGNYMGYGISTYTIYSVNYHATTNFHIFCCKTENVEKIKHLPVFVTIVWNNLRLVETKVIKKINISTMKMHIVNKSKTSANLSQCVCVSILRIFFILCSMNGYIKYI